MSARLLGLGRTAEPSEAEVFKPPKITHFQHPIDPKNSWCGLNPKDMAKVIGDPVVWSGPDCVVCWDFWHRHGTLGWIALRDSVASATPPDGGS